MARTLLDPAASFTVQESDLEVDMETDPAVSYTLRPWTMTKSRELAKRHERHRPQRSQRQTVRTFNEEAMQDEMVDYVIQDWAGVMVGGEPAPCELDYKMCLPDEILGALLTMARRGPSEEDEAASFRQSA